SIERHRGGPAGDDRRAATLLRARAQGGQLGRSGAPHRRMDGVIATHFGAAQVDHRREILDRLRQVRAMLVNFEARGKSYACRGLDSMCDMTTHAWGGEDGILFCGVGSEPPYLSSPWRVLLHEMFHVTFPNSLPIYDKATETQR